MGTNTPNFGLYKPSVGETNWGGLVDANWDTIDTNMVTTLPRSYLAGMQLSNNLTSPTVALDISAGQATDTANTGSLLLSTILTKFINSTWVVGSGNGGMAPGVSLTSLTWYHVFAIKRTDTNVVDAMFDTSITAAHIPSPYTLYRRLGSVKTSNTSQILAFSQDGDYFRWSTSQDDIVSGANPGTSAILATLTGVPPGVMTTVLANITVSLGASPSSIYVSDPAVTDEAPVATGAHPGATMTVAASANGSQQIAIHTDTTPRIRYRLTFSDGSTFVRMATLGWIDRRGRDT